MPGGSLRPRGSKCRRRWLGAGARPEGSDARKFGSGNGLRRSERSGCGCRKLRSHRPESRPAKNSALLRLPAPQTEGSNAANLQRSEPPEGRPGAVFQGADAGEPAFAAGLGPANGIAAGLGDRRCGSGSAYALGLPCSGEPGRLARWFGGKARRSPGRIPEGLETPTPGQQLRGTAARRAARKESKPPQKRRSRLPCPGTFRKRNTLP